MRRNRGTTYTNPILSPIVVSTLYACMYVTPNQTYTILPTFMLLPFYQTFIEFSINILVIFM